jgi:pilus assembly protein Flp/PilA
VALLHRAGFGGGKEDFAMWWVHFENWLRRPFLPGRKRGAAFTEYAVLLALVAVVVIAAVTVFGERLADLFENVTSQLPSG